MDRNEHRKFALTRRRLLQSGSLALIAGWSPSLRPARGQAKASGVIDFMSWEGYDFPNEMKAWKEANAVELQSTYMGSHDDIQAKILGGGGEGLDLITYGSSYKQLYRELKILQPIDIGQDSKSRESTALFRVRCAEHLGRNRRHAHRRARGLGRRRHQLRFRA